MFTLQVKIKRKQRLVRKEIEPVISHDDMKNAPTAEGTSIFCLFSFSFCHNLSLGELMLVNIFRIQAQ